jgi:hypothetical protein
MIRQYVVHIEWHRGYRPRLSIRRRPRHGDRVVDGGEPGTLIACRECGGDGMLHLRDRPPAASAPTSLDMDLDPEPSKRGPR